MIEQVELPAWQAGRSCSRGDIFTRIASASAEERFLLSSDYFPEVMAIIKWEAAMEESDRVDMTLFGFLYAYDDASLSNDVRQGQLLHAIERWGRITHTTLNPFNVWQSYWKTITRFALLTDERSETEGNAEQSEYGKPGAAASETDGLQSVLLPTDAGQPGVIGYGVTVPDLQWDTMLEPAHV